MHVLLLINPCESAADLNPKTLQIVFGLLVSFYMTKLHTVPISPETSETQIYNLNHITLSSASVSLEGFQQSLEKNKGLGTPGRLDGRSDGRQKRSFQKKRYYQLGRVRTGRIFPSVGRVFPSVGRPGQNLKSKKVRFVKKGLAWFQLLDYSLLVGFIFIIFGSLGRC